MTTLESTSDALVSGAPSPGLLDRLAARLALRALEGIREGAVLLTLPDGTTRRFGAEEARPVRLVARSWRPFRALLAAGDLGAAEAYLDGEWTADDLPGLVRLFARNADLLDRETWATRLTNVANRLLHARNRNSRAGSRRNVPAHYDLGNDLYETFLDPSMTYSCALFETGDETLEEAQEKKLRRIAEKARIRPGDHVLEIGCGWGAFALLAAREYGARVTGITLSTEQAARARERVAREGLADRVEIRLVDYRDLPAEGRTYDRVVSVEMLEAVGEEFLPGYFEVVDRLLAPDGIAVIQSITVPDDRYDRYRRRPDFIQKYVFPGSHCPSVGAIVSAVSARSRLLVHHLEDVGAHYAETLRRWREAFLANRPRVRQLGYDERFTRLWDFYLAYCEGGFAERHIGDVQVVLTRSGNHALGPAPGYRGEA
ncbi:MAG: cyclopropane-fatty-acyl-phospholipid synthase family protein [Thermoanaerobaculia bacterium]|nr:cyclopropane-fatty-acyl-phospholipid synthase family protein [Thermoanaerobaculia bacterium]